VARKFNIDEIAMMSDEEIINRLRAVRSYIDKISGPDSWDRFAEEDACYFQRELEIRRTRRAAHEEHLARKAELRNQARVSRA
jgi:hypothetical protein